MESKSPSDDEHFKFIAYFSNSIFIIPALSHNEQKIRQKIESKTKSIINFIVGNISL